MKVEFIGVGEALDGEMGNSSFLVHSETKLLIDCGFAVPTLYWQRAYESDFLDAIYLTHWHADHIFGLPALLLDLSLRKRSRELVIIGQPGTEMRCRELCALAYQTLIPQLSFPLRFIETIEPLQFRELELVFAKTIHTLSNYALRIDADGMLIGFSGDGELTEDSRNLFRSCRYLVHESFSATEHLPNHTSLKELIAFTDEIQTLRWVALVHLNAQQRRKNLPEFHSLIGGAKHHFLLPRPGEEIGL